MVKRVDLQVALSETDRGSVRRCGKPLRNVLVVANCRMLSAGYLEALNIPLPQGRRVGDADRDTMQSVVGDQRSDGQDVFPNQDPIGNTREGTAELMEVPVFRRHAASSFVWCRHDLGSKWNITSRS